MELAEYRPVPSLVVDSTPIDRPLFEVIDFHNHLSTPWDEAGGETDPAEARDRLDAAGVDLVVDLDGGWGENILDDHLARFKTAHPDRFKIFGGVDWSAWQEHGDQFGDWAAARLDSQAARGAEGLKIWKALGLHVRDHNDRLVGVDDERLDPLWATAGDLGLPIVIHVADPVAFFDPLDNRNERYEELVTHPDWHVPSPPFPSFSSIVESMARVVQRHPGTDFVGAHVGCYAENLEWVGNLLRRCDNFWVDISARIAELGRQPQAARKFFVEFGDRILFGLDMGLDRDSYRLSYRFLETEDEYFDYSTSAVPPQGRWKISGLHLPGDVLENVYRNNARRLLGEAG